MQVGMKGHFLREWGPFSQFIWTANHTKAESTLAMLTGVFPGLVQKQCSADAVRCSSIINMSFSVSSLTNFVPFLLCDVAL